MMDILHYEFMRNALIGGILAAIACGIIGTYVVVNRIVFISGGISHTAFGGVGLGYFLGINPLWGAAAFTVLSALGLGAVSRKSQQRMDTLIGILWALGMALGVIFIRFTPGYVPDLMSWLFGSILTIPRSDIYLMAGLDFFILLFVWLFYKELLAFSFDEEYAAISGVPVERLYLLLFAMIGVTIVILIQVVGIILVIALLTLPAATSAFFTKSLKGMMALSVVLGIVYNLSGLWLSYLFNLPSGATIILVSGMLFLLASGFTQLRKRNFSA